ncbi:MAG: hypothetical protein Q6358_01040, partial [Candidatus Brocadiales bacterium]|nr:hypothetical protein [Candidatus Brocadiales bacterium]
METSGDIGEELVSNFFDNNFSEILSFRNPKTKDNAQIADIVIWLNRIVFLIEVKTLISSEYSVNDWAKDRIKKGIDQLEKNFKRINSNEEIFLNNKCYHVKLDCQEMVTVIGVVILVHEGDCSLKPSMVCDKIYESTFPIHVFSWQQFKKFSSEIDTIPDFKYYLQDRIDFVKNCDIPLNKELDAIGLYKMGNNTFPNENIDFNNSDFWKQYLRTMKKERSRREQHNKHSGWLDRLEEVFTENRRQFHGIPLGLHFAWVFASLSRRERALMGTKFEKVQDWFLSGKQSRQFAIFIPATGHWVVFYYSKHSPVEQQRILLKLIEQKLIVLKEDENFQFAVFGIGIQISKLWPPRIMGIANAMIIGVDEVIGKYSKQDVIDARRNWRNRQVYKVEE